MLHCLSVVTETNGASITIDADAAAVDDMEKKTSRLQIMFSLSRVRPIHYTSYAITYERPQAMFVCLTHVYRCTPVYFLVNYAIEMCFKGVNDGS